MGNAGDDAELIYMILRIALLFIDISIMAVLGKRIHIEIRNEFIDFFRLIQYSIIIFHGIYEIITTGVVILQYFRNDLSLEYFIIVELTPLFYFHIDQLGWYTLIKHISTLKFLHAGQEYEDLHKKIRKFEIKSILILVLILVCLMLFYTFPVLVYANIISGSFDNIITQVRYIFDAFVITLAIISVNIGYKFTVHSLKNNLNYYYK